MLKQMQYIFVVNFGTLSISNTLCRGVTLNMALTNQQNYKLIILFTNHYFVTKYGHIYLYVGISFYLSGQLYHLKKKHIYNSSVPFLSFLYYFPGYPSFPSIPSFFHTLFHFISEIYLSFSSFLCFSFILLFSYHLTFPSFFY